MFQKGDRVVCVNEKMDPISAVLNKGQVYTVKEHLTLEEYEKQNPGSDWWLKEGVRESWKDGFVHLRESLGADGSDLNWHANRFTLVVPQKT